MLVLGLCRQLNLIDMSTLLTLYYDRASIQNGEYWRLFSGHFVHLNLAHATMNISALSLLMMMVWKDLSYPSDLCALIFLIFGINLGLYFFHPELTLYAGFSGVLHGLFIYYFIKILPQHKTGSIILLSIVAIKIIWEQSPWSDTSDTEKLIGGSVATMAHLYGGICGLLAGMSYLLLRKK